MDSKTTVQAVKRKRGVAETKVRILAAAKKCFAQFGYAQVGVREIAIEAGVNNSLITRYFESKAKLFEAALLDCIDLSPLESDPDAFVENSLQSILSQDPKEAEMNLRSAGDPEVDEIITRICNKHSLPRVAEYLDGPNAEERALNIMILTCGYLVVTQIMKIGLGDNPYAREWYRNVMRNIVDPGPANG